MWVEWVGDWQWPACLDLGDCICPELRRKELRPAEYPRTDYVEMAKRMESTIVDYSIYDGCKRGPFTDGWRGKRGSTCIWHFVAYRMARAYDVVMLMSELVAFPYMMLQKVFGRRAATVFVSSLSSPKQAKLVRRFDLFSSLDIAVSNAQAQQRFLVDDMAIHSQKVRCVLYAVDEEFYTPGAGGSYVLSAGTAYRDYDTLCRAVDGLSLDVKIAVGGRPYSCRTQLHSQQSPRERGIAAAYGLCGYA